MSCRDPGAQHLLLHLLHTISQLIKLYLSIDYLLIMLCCTLFGRSFMEKETHSVFYMVHLDLKCSLGHALSTLERYYE